MNEASYDGNKGKGSRYDNAAGQIGVTKPGNKNMHSYKGSKMKYHIFSPHATGAHFYDERNVSIPLPKRKHTVGYIFILWGQCSFAVWVVNINLAKIPSSLHFFEEGILQYLLLTLYNYSLVNRINCLYKDIDKY